MSDLQQLVNNLSDAMAEIRVAASAIILMANCADHDLDGEPVAWAATQIMLIADKASGENPIAPDTQS